MKYLRKFQTHSQYEAATLDLPNVSYCVQQNEVHYNPKEYKYVDLGLPSGLLWATMNVGANSETDYGLYFQWGDTQGYTASEVGSGGKKKAFKWSDYKYSNGGSSAADMTKYNSTDKKTTLDLEDDAARVNMGGNWRMPTEAEFQELINNTTNQQVTDYNGSGINGRLLTSKTDSSKKLFFPAAGGVFYSNVNYIGTNGFYWSSSINSSDTIYSQILFFSPTGNISTGDAARYDGLSIRGVKSSNEKFTPVSQLDAYIERDQVIILMEQYINVYNNILNTEFSLVIPDHDFYYYNLKETSSSADTTFMYLVPLNEGNWFVLYSYNSGKCFIQYINDVTGEYSGETPTIDWTKDLNHYIYE